MVRVEVTDLRSVASTCNVYAAKLHYDTGRCSIKINVDVTDLRSVTSTLIIIQTRCIQAAFTFQRRGLCNPNPVCLLARPVSSFFICLLACNVSASCGCFIILFALKANEFSKFVL